MSVLLSARHRYRLQVAVDRVACARTENADRMGAGKLYPVASYAPIARLMSQLFPALQAVWHQQIHRVLLDEPIMLGYPREVALIDASDQRIPTAQRLIAVRVLQRVQPAIVARERLRVADVEAVSAQLGQQRLSNLCSLLVRLIRVWPTVVFSERPEDNYICQLCMTVAVAAPRRLRDGLQRPPCAPHQREIHIHPRLHALSGYEPTRLCAIQPPPHLVQHLLTMRRTHGGRQVEDIILCGKPIEQRPCVTLQIHDAQHLPTLSQPLRQLRPAKRLVVAIGPAHRSPPRALKQLQIGRDYLLRPPAGCAELADRIMQVREGRLGGGGKHDAGAVPVGQAGECGQSGHRQRAG